MTPIEIAVAAGIVIVCGVLLFLAVTNQQRQTRDAQRLEATRTLQAQLEFFRGEHASYPAMLDAIPGNHAGYVYAATPDGCGEDKATLCLGYTLGFQLEGQIGGLTGGRCTAGPKGVTCAR